MFLLLSIYLTFLELYLILPLFLSLIYYLMEQQAVWSLYNQLQP